MSREPRAPGWRCGFCGCQDANHVISDGHDRRGLDTRWGHFSDLRVPMVECQQCQRDVVRAFAIWEKEKRRWMDLDQDVLVGSGFGERVQQMTARWSTTIEGRVGLRTLNERINQIEPLAHCAHRQWLDALPPVFQVDGMWVTIHR